MAEQDDGGGEPTGAATAFYDRWATVYDLVASRTPGVARLRRRAVDALRLEPGDIVVEMGCGTGANLPLLAEAVGPTGRVIGVDVSAGVLGRARRRTRGHPRVEVVRGDAIRPPIGGGIDGVLATFVVGMLDEPGDAVDRWCDLVAPGGHAVLVNLRKSRHPGAPVWNRALAVATVLSTPPTTTLRYERDLTELLDERVRLAHDRLRERASATAEETHAFDLVGLTGGRLPPN